MTTIRDTMTKNPAFCTRETPLTHIAKAMVEHDCGAIPVLESDDDHTPVGIVTDRDIVCRTLAKDIDPCNCTANDVMTSPCVTIRENASIDEACNLMEKHLVRRLVVVDDQNHCTGMLALGDIAQEDRSTAAEITVAVSRHTDEPSHIH